MFTDGVTALGNNGVVGGLCTLRWFGVLGTEGRSGSEIKMKPMGKL